MERRGDKRIRCQKCRSERYKIVYTHGYKSRGYKVCKRCRGD